MQKKKKLLITCMSICVMFILLAIDSKANTYFVIQNTAGRYTMYGKYSLSITGSSNVYGCHDEIHGNAQVGTPVRLNKDEGGRNLGDAPNGNKYGGNGNSSSARLSKPTNSAEIVKAYLIIESTQYDANTSVVLGNRPPTLKAPNGNELKPKPLDNLIYSTMPVGQDAEPYARISTYAADVTKFVQDNGFGYYQVWDIPYYPLSRPKQDQIASWKLLVITEDDSTPLRMVTFYLGCKDTNIDTIKGNLKAEISGNGIKTKATGNVTGQIILGGAGGDPDQEGSKFAYQPSPNVGQFYLKTYSKSRGVYTNRENTFFGGILTHNGELLNGPAIVGYRNSDNLPFHNNDFILMDLNKESDWKKNGHNAYLTNNSSKVKISAGTDGTAGTLTVYGLSADIDVATYKSAITHKGQVYQDANLEMSAHLENNTITSESQTGVKGGYGTIKIDNKITLDSSSIVATFYDKSDNQKVTLPKSMITVNGNTIIVKYGKDANGISQVGDTLDISFKGKPKVTGSYTNTIEMYATHLIDAGGRSYKMDNEMKMSSSKDIFTAIHNNPPVINAKDRTFYEGSCTQEYWKNTLRWKDVSASDKEDTPGGTYPRDRIKITSDYVNVNKNGKYNVTYSVTDNHGKTATKTVTITVLYNNPPVINAKDRTFYEGSCTQDYWKNTLRWKDVSASDKEDTPSGTYPRDRIKITSDNVNVNKNGKYNVTYSVTDNHGKTATKTVTITVLYNNPPVINAKDRTFYEGSCTQYYWKNTLRWKDVSASDKEDTPNSTYPLNRISIIADNVNVNKVGTYNVTYKVTDNFGKSTTKIVTVKVVYNNPPTIKGEDRWFFDDETITNQMLLERVKADDIEDGNITKKAIIKSHNVQSGVIGDYTITYKVTDAFGKSAETTNKVYIVKKIPTGDEYNSRLRFISKKYINTLAPNSIWRTSGYSEILNNTLNKTQNSQAKEHWKLMPEDIQKIKEFNDQHGWSEESNRLFLEQFRYLLQ